MLAVDGRRGIGVADVAAGAVAGPPAAVIPATRVLRNIPANRALVANLRRSHEFGGLRQNRILLSDQRMPHYVAKNRRSADLDADIGRCFHTSEFLDAANIDDYLRTFVAILQPIECVQPPGEHPRGLLISVEQRQGIVDSRRLKEFESGHYV